MHVTNADNILAQIDEHQEASQDDGRRRHLGGSLIGRECNRELWYSFRWATRIAHKARLLRLFNRGHKEEFRFVEYLRGIGIEVRDYSQRLMYHDGSDCYTCIDWDDTSEHVWAECVDVSTDQAHIERATARNEGPTQWRVTDVDGHFGGSLDGIAYGFAEQEIAPGVFIAPSDPILLEFKTHGQKSFDKLCADGLLKAKPEHFAQMQVYMSRRGIRAALYMAVNKNTDDLKLFWVIALPSYAVNMLSKARDVIVSPVPPPRLSNSPTWFKCRFCDHRGVCHLGNALEKNCRTCAMSKPIEDGNWYCAHWQSVIPSEAQKDGCDHYAAIPQ